jgi:hypothetical protein
MIPQVATGNKSPVIEPAFVTMSDGCRYLAVSRSKMYSDIAEGLVDAVKEGRRTLLVFSSLKKRGESRKPAAIGAGDPKFRALRDMAEKTGRRRAVKRNDRVAHRNGADLDSALTEIEAQLFVQGTGECNGRIDSRTRNCRQVAIHAELSGDDTAGACGITTQGSSPILNLCGMLIASGHDPDTPLEAWRGSTLALTIRSIGEGPILRAPVL